MLKLNLLNSYSNQRVNSIINSFLTDSFEDFYNIHNIEETENQYKISIDLPGYSQKDIEINIENNLLSVKAKNEKRGNIEKYFNLNNGINQDNISAKINDGVLEILIDKLNKRKRIDIK